MARLGKDTRQGLEKMEEVIRRVNREPLCGSSCARLSGARIVRATSATESLRSTSATARAPRLASSTAVAAPIPLAAPVTTATFPRISR
jgi:hypothetical protein